MPDIRTIFADGILDASVTHGVARLTLAQTGPEGKPVASGQLVMPLSQLPGFTNGLVGLLKQIEAKVKEAQALQQAAGGGGSRSPTPTARCIVTTSIHRPNLAPAERIIPTWRKPSETCRPMEPTFSESPITAKTCRKPHSSARRSSAATSALPTPWPRMSSRT